MTGLVLGVDQGTSSTRCVAFDERLATLGAHAVPVSASCPAPGLVEQDPIELADSARAAVSGALRAAGARMADVLAVGIANQTETFLLADRRSARPIHPAIVWQDRRTAPSCDALRSAGHGERVRELTGLELDATFPATKIAWLLDRLAGTRDAASRGELRYHDVGSWLLLSLCGGAEACEIGNAGRTLLCALGADDWSAELLELFDVPRALMPPIVDSDGLHAQLLTDDGSAPLRALLGDQQASLLGLRCHEPGMAKVTLGTGAFVLAQAGRDAPRPPAGVLASCAWRRRGRAAFALEGFVPTAGAALSWFSQLGVLPEPRALDALLAGAGVGRLSRPGPRGAVAAGAGRSDASSPAAESSDAGSPGAGRSDASSPGRERFGDGPVVCVPALQGLGTPSWDAETRGALLGLSRATTRAEIARAVVDGVLHQVADALDAISVELPIATVLLDGGMSRSAWIVQRLADIAGVRVQRASGGEATAAGAAMLAGMAAGVWGDPRDLPPLAVDLAAEPRWSEEERAERRVRWAAACSLVREWRP
ncbi:MAG TPA: FGGY family carbohydrate kinase [Solirubrobacteraceae bacterium]|nr:FGGY family carbohydrate kinase [Solirubrobacteraceae bacterium]